jgi:hypothetical protein
MCTSLINSTDTSILQKTATTPTIQHLSESIPTFNRSNEWASTENKLFQHKFFSGKTAGALCLHTKGKASKLKS